MYKKRWANVLGFRQKSLFTQCEVCWTLKSQLSDKKVSMNHKLGCLEQYRKHLHDQFCDRSIIWKLQSESADWNTDFLIISTDGLDQSKFSLPRDKNLKASAALKFGFIALFSSSTLFELGSVSSCAKCLIHSPDWQLRAKHQRPRVKVHGAWAFGYTLNVYVLDDSAPHDSSAIIEIVAATIEDVSCHTPCGFVCKSSQIKSTNIFP